MDDADAAFEAGFARLLKFLRRALEPGGGHPGIVVPDRGEALPVAGVAPEHPVIDDLDDREAVERGLVHAAQRMIRPPGPPGPPPGGTAPGTMIEDACSRRSSSSRRIVDRKSVV